MGIKLGNIDAKYIKVGSDDCKVYLGDTLVYSGGTPPTPTGSTCYEVINDPITAYTATTYDSAYSFADSKWYMKNNLNQYEKYGIYDTANTLSDLTYYDGKLAAVGTTEYQYSGGSWINVGTYITTEVSYDVPSGYSTTYQGQTIPTTFKISVADMNVLGTRYISIYDTETPFYLQASKTAYRYNGATRITGTVTSDSDYYYFTLTDEKPSIEIYRTRGYYGTVHIITEEKSVTVEYPEKDMPLAKAYQSVAAMETEACPTVGVGQYGVVGSDVYQFDSTEEWVTVGNHYKVMERSANAANVVGCNSSSGLTTGDTKPSYFDYSGMTEAIIGDCTTSIGGTAFQNCGSLSSVTIGSGVTSIGSNAFSGCTSLTSVTLPSGLTSIGSYAFGNCSGLTSVNMPNSVTSVGSNAFSGCTSLPVENNIRYADTYVIETIDKTLTTYTIKSDSRFINNNIFSGCTALTSVTIPDSVTSIGNYAFDGCTSLTSVTLPSGLTSIGICFFNGCTGLTSVNIPSGVTTIGSSAFTHCVMLKENLDLPNVTSIGSYAFESCGITSLNIPNVTTIGSYAFAYCSYLQNITMPNVTSIGSYAFYYLEGSNSIVIPSGVTTINYATFSNSELSNITLPETITYIGGAAFWGITILSLTIYATTPPTLGTDAFKNVRQLTILVPSASVDTYKSASGWSTYASSIRAIPNS